MSKKQATQKPCRRFAVSLSRRPVRLQSDGTYSYTYDGNGKMLTQKKGNQTTNFTWDYENRLTAITGSSYTYDYLGRRKSKTIGSTTTTYLYDGQNLIYELSGSTGADYLFGPGIDEPLAMSRSAQVYYYSTDGLGSVGIVSDAAGVVKNKYSYDAWGAIKSQTAAVSSPFGYTAREFAEVGTWFYRYRYMFPTVGRFISEDPIGFDGGINFYAYVSNAPLHLTDPFGLCDVQIRCRSIRGDTRKEKMFSILGVHCYIMATDRDGNFLQVSAGATKDRSRSESGSGLASEGSEPQYKQDNCIKCTNGGPEDVECEKVDCLKKMARVYNDRKYGYNWWGGALTAPNSNSFVGWIMAVCGMKVDPSAWPLRAKGCYYWTGED